MSGDERITVRVRRDGTVQAETRGIKGDRCVDYVDVLQDIVGAKVVDSHFTEEYWEQAVDEDAVETRRRVHLEPPS